MLKSYEIREIIKLFDQSSLQEMQVKLKKSSLTLKKEPAFHAVQDVEGTQSVHTSPHLDSQVVLTPLSTSQKLPVPIGEMASTLDSAQQNIPKAQNIAEHQQTMDEGKVSEANQANSAEEDWPKIVSPMVGTFYLAPSPESAPFVQVGDKVEQDTIVCIVEAMKLFNEIEADCQGEIVRVLVQDGQLVEQGQPLFIVKPE